MATFKIFILTILAAIVFGSPVHALEIGDSVRFPTDSSFGCSLIEDARQATAHVARYGGSKESSKRFVYEIYDPGVRRAPGTPIPTRLCDFFFPGAAVLSITHEVVVFEYRVLKKSDDGYVCLTDPRGGLFRKDTDAIKWDTHPSNWEGRCLWVNLQVWNVQTTPHQK
jgi:hypothetical protein